MWQPAWGSKNAIFYLKFIHSNVVRTILLALRDHFTTDDKAAIGYLDYSRNREKNWPLNQKLEM